ELLVPQPRGEMNEEPFLLLRPDVVDRIVRGVGLEQRVVLLPVGRRAVVEHDDPHFVPVAPEVLVVRINRLRDIPETVGGNHEGQLGFSHLRSQPRIRSIDSDQNVSASEVTKKTSFRPRVPACCRGHTAFDERNPRTSVRHKTGARKFTSTPSDPPVASKLAGSPVTTMTWLGSS